MGSMRSAWSVLLGGALSLVGSAALQAEPPPSAASAIPASNRPRQTKPPARPAASSAEARIRRLFDAVVADDPVLAEGVFFPRDAFLLVKGIRDPGRYYDQLNARFIADIHALHRRLPGLAQARFVRFDLAQRGGFVKEGEEANRLPYWAARHSFLVYETGGQTVRVEVRVLITWDDQWYVIHLNEFR